MSNPQNTACDGRCEDGAAELGDDLGRLVLAFEPQLREEQEWTLCTALRIQGGDKFAAAVRIDGPLSVMELLRPAMTSGPGTIERIMADWPGPGSLGDVHHWDRGTYRRILVALHAELLRLLSGLNIGVERLGIELEAFGIVLFQRGRE